MISGEEDWDLPLLFDEQVSVVQTTRPRTMLGNIGEFDGSQETWSSYVERFELFCDCNKVENDKKVSTRVKTYALLRNLCTPDKPASKEFKEIVKIIQDHLYPKPSFIAERYKFSKRNQLDHETVSEYIASLKRLSIHCDFGASLNDYLRDRLVSGIKSETTKQRLLAEAALTYDNAVKIILSVEWQRKMRPSWGPVTTPEVGCSGWRLSSVGYSGASSRGNLDRAEDLTKISNRYRIGLPMVIK